MNRARARALAKELFPMNLYGTNYNSYEALRRQDPIACDDLLDHIEFNEPLNPGSIKEIDKNDWYFLKSKRAWTYV